MTPNIAPHPNDSPPGRPGMVSEPALPGLRWGEHIGLRRPAPARIDADLDDLVIEAADRLNVTKTTFVADAIQLGRTAGSLWSQGSRWG